MQIIYIYTYVVCNLCNSLHARETGFLNRDCQPFIPLVSKSKFSPFYASCRHPLLANGHGERRRIWKLWGLLKCSISCVLSLGSVEVLYRGPPTFFWGEEEEWRSQYGNISLSHMPVRLPVLEVITAFWTLMRHCFIPMQFGWHDECGQYMSSLQSLAWTSEVHLFFILLIFF